MPVVMPIFLTFRPHSNCSRGIAALLAGLTALTGASLGAETSALAAAPTAFARAQAASTIHWQPWNDATLARARESGRSVYVFVGSPLSELTRATLNQTFTSATTTHQ